MIDGWFLEVTNLIINNTQVDVSQEFTSDISDFFMLHMVLDGIIIVDWVYFTQFHVVNTNAVVS